MEPVLRRHRRRRTSHLKKEGRAGRPRTHRTASATRSYLASEPRAPYTPRERLRPNTYTRRAPRAGPPQFHAGARERIEKRSDAAFCALALLANNARLLGWP